MNAAQTVTQSEVAPTCSVLSILLPVTGRWLGCHEVNCTGIHSDPRVFVQFAFCLGGTIFLGVTLAAIAAFRREPAGARVAACIFQCAALAWLLAIVFR